MTRRALLFAAACCLALSLLPAPLAARTAHEAPADVTAAILAALPKTERNAVQIGPSAAGRMARCLAPLSASIIGDGIYRTVRIDCASPRWNIYVGVSLGRMETVLVATRNIPLGKALTIKDFRWAQVRSTDLPGKPISARDAIGKQIAAPLAPGDIITSSDVIMPVAVHNGEKLVIHYARSGVTATAVGTALESGTLGQSILVQNDESHREITATIVGAGEPILSGQSCIIASR